MREKIDKKSETKLITSEKKKESEQTSEKERERELEKTQKEIEKSGDSKRMIEKK